MTVGVRRLLTVALAACASYWLATALGAPPARAAEGSGWQHALRVAAALRVAPPNAPTVLLLGGSSARECTASDGRWAAQTRRRSGSRVVTYNAGSRNQTFEQDIALVQALPKVPMLMYIGVNLGRFTSPPTHTTSTIPLATKGTYVQHHYRKARSWTRERKQRQVRYWMRQRYPIFEERYAANLSQLDELIGLCKQRGYHPVVLDLPRNTEIIGEAFASPIQRYHKGCKALAARHAIPFVNFVAAAHLADSDFHDLTHLGEPGRTEFQKLLSDKTAKLLTRYDLTSPATTKAGLEAGPALLPRTTSRTKTLAGLGAVALVFALLAVQRRRVVVRRRRRERLRRARRRALVRQRFLLEQGHLTHVAPGSPPPAARHPGPRARREMCSSYVASTPGDHSDHARGGRRAWAPSRATGASSGGP